MLRTIVGVLLASCALAAQASPIVFSSMQFDTVAVASAGSVAQVDSASSPPAGLPLISSAVAISGGDFASAAAIADSGLLVAQSEVSSLQGVASATAFAQFIGAFSLPSETKLKFWIDLDDQDFTDVSASSVATLFLQLTFGGMTYADLLFTGNDPIYFTVDIPSAGDAVLSLLLSSEASTLGAGNAANFAQAQILVVPEPGTLVLLLAGVGLLGWVGQSRRPARERLAPI